MTGQQHNGAVIFDCDFSHSGEGRQFICRPSLFLYTTCLLAVTAMPVSHILHTLSALGGKKKKERAFTMCRARHRRDKGSAAKPQKYSLLSPPRSRQASICAQTDSGMKNRSQNIRSRHKNLGAASTNRMPAPRINDAVKNLAAYLTATFTAPRGVDTT